MAVHVSVLLILGMASMVIAVNVNLGFFTPRDSPCPSIPEIGDFNISRYVGNWYENKRFTFALQENTKCVKNTYFERTDGGMNLIYYRELIWPTPVQIRTRVVLQPTTPGTFEAKTKIGSTWVYMGTYSVIVPGYDDATFVYSCQNLLFGTAVEAAWIMTRTRGLLTSGQETTLTSAATSLGIDPANFKTANTMNCVD